MNLFTFVRFRPQVTFAGVDLTSSGQRPMHNMAAVGDGDISYFDLNESSFRGFFEHLNLTLRRRVMIASVQ